MIEGLRSSNEELQTFSDELHSLLQSLHAGLVIVDEGLRVLSWNSRAEELWGLRSEESLGQHLLSLKIGLPVEALRQPTIDCVSGRSDGSDQVLEAVPRLGKPIRCRVRVMPFRENGRTVGAVLIMDSEPS